MNPVEQIRETLLRPPSAGEFEQGGIKLSLLLDAWRARDLFKYESNTPQVYRPAAEVSAIPVLSQDCVDINKSFLERLGYDSVVDFLLVTYASNMQKFAGFQQFQGPSERESEKVILPDKPGKFIGAVLEGKFRVNTDGVSEALPIFQTTFAESVGLSQAFVSTVISGKVPVRVASFLMTLEGLPVSSDLKLRAMAEYLPNNQYIVTRDADRPLIERYRAKFGGVFIGQHWMTELKQLDQASLLRCGFTSAEELLLARYMNTTKRLFNTVDFLQTVPESSDQEEITRGVSNRLNILSLDELNRYDRVWGSVVLDAWSARALFRVPSSKQKEAVDRAEDILGSLSAVVEQLITSGLIKREAGGKGQAVLDLLPLYNSSQSKLEE